MSLRQMFRAGGSLVTVVGAAFVLSLPSFDFVSFVIGVAIGWAALLILEEKPV